MALFAVLWSRASTSQVQTCFPTVENWEINSFDGPKRAFRECYINGIDLVNDTSPVKTVISGRSIKPESILLVYYGNERTIKFIPNSLFSMFKNLEYFMIFDNNHFETLKSEYLKNAIKLKVFRVMSNDIKRLDRDVFIEAPNLENINLRDNKIETVHQLAFNGLNNLKGIYLIDNMITHIHPTTFSHLNSLQTINLVNNMCINIIFRYFQDRDQIEIVIKKLCNYDLETVELTAAHETEVEMISANECQAKMHVLEERLQQQDAKNPHKQFMEEFSTKIKEDMKILIQKNVKETCLTEINKSENIFLKGYMTLVQLVQDQKAANQKDDDEISKTCKRDISELQKNIEKVTESYEKIFKMLEQDGFQLQSNEEVY